MPGISPQVFWPYFAAAAFTLLGMIVAPRNPLSGWRDWRFLFASGPLCIAIPMAVFGADHLSDARDIMRIVPAWMPWRLFWAYFVGFCLLAAALSIVLRIQVRLASLLLGGMLVAFVVLIHIPSALTKPGDRMRWIYAARDLVFGCGALTLGMTAGNTSSGRARFTEVIQFVIPGIAAFFGIEHLLHTECVPGVPLEGLMPAWIPLGRMWTALTGVALIAGGLAMLVGRTREIAATALGVVVLLVVVMIYVPMMIVKPDVDSLNYVFDTLVLAGTFLVAGSAASFGGRGRVSQVKASELTGTTTPVL